MQTPEIRLGQERKKMVLGHLGFGIICAITLALHTLTAGAPFGLVLLAYSFGGMAGLLLSATLPDNRAETPT